MRYGGRYFLGNMAVWECFDCGAVASDQRDHDLFHTRLDDIEAAIKALDIKTLPLTFIGGSGH